MLTAGKGCYEEDGDDGEHFWDGAVDAGAVRVV